MYEMVIRSALAAANFQENVVIFPGSLSGNIYVGCRYRKDCIIQMSDSMVVILLPWYCGSEKSTLEVIDRIDLCAPDSISRFGDILSRVLLNRI